MQIAKLKQFTQKLGSKLGGGSDTIEFSLAYPKYKDLYKHINNFIILLNFLSTLAEQANKKNTSNTIITYCDVLKKTLTADLIKMDPDQLEGLMKLLEITGDNKKIAKQFIDKYVVFKNSTTIHTILKFMDNLHPHEKDLSVDSMSFLNTLKSFKPVPDLDVDFIWLYKSVSDSSKNHYKNTICKLYGTADELYKTICVPDISAHKFHDSIMQSVQQMRKVIPRCDAAFNIIQKSTTILDDNYKEYYKDFISSGNEGIIASRYIEDVGISVKDNKTAADDFSKLIMEMRKLAAKNSKMNAQSQKQLDEMSTLLSKMGMDTNPDELVEEINNFNISEK